MPRFARSCLRIAAVAALVMAAPFAARAQSDSPLSVGLGVGSDGLNGTVGVDLGENFGVRVGGSWFRISKGVDTSTVHYSGHFRPQIFNLMLDLYPFDSGFRITGGGIYNRNLITLTATPSATTTIGNTAYTPAQLGQINGRVDFRSASPYAGLGITTNRNEAGWQFVADAGVIFAGHPNVKLTSTGPFANDPTFRNNLAIEQARIADKLDWLRFYPLVKIGLAYHF